MGRAVWMSEEAERLGRERDEAYERYVTVPTVETRNAWQAASKAYDEQVHEDWIAGRGR